VLLLQLLLLWSCITIFWGLLDCLQLPLHFFAFLHLPGLFLGLLLLLPHALTLRQPVQALLLLQLEVESRTELVSRVDPQSIFELLHVQLLSEGSLMRLLGVYHGRRLLQFLLQVLACPLQAGLQFLFGHPAVGLGAQLLLQFVDLRFDLAFLLMLNQILVGWARGWQGVFFELLEDLAIIQLLGLGPGQHVGQVLLHIAASA